MDPQTGRFINADRIDILDETKNQINGLNLYAYCGGNPVMNIDPSGEFFFSILIGAIVAGAVIGGTVGGVQAAQNGTNILGGILGGAIMGGAMGGLLAFGGGVALGAAGGFTLVGGLMLSAGVGIAAGWASYSVEAGLNGNWNVNDFGKSGMSGMLKGMATFGIGFVGGKAFGAYDKLILKPLMQGANPAFADIAYQMGKVIMHGGKGFLPEIVAGALTSLAAAGARWLIDLIFDNI